MEKKTCLFSLISSFFFQNIKWRQIYFWWPLFFLSCSSGVPELIEGPSLIANPNPAAPLVPFLQFKANEPVRAEIEIFDGGQKRWLFKPQGLFQQVKAIPLFQFNPDKEYQVKLRIIDTWDNVSKQTEVVTYQTPALPADFPSLNLIRTLPEKREPGYTLVSVARPQESGSPAFLIALNRQGEVAWYFRHPQILGLLQKSRRGNILTNNQKDVILELDLTGKIIQSYEGKNYEKGLRRFFRNTEIQAPTRQISNHQLQQTGNILNAKRKENTAPLAPYTILQEWSHQSADSENIFEMELKDGFEILGILHLPDLLLPMEGT